MRKQIVPLSGVVLLSPKKIKKFLCRNHYIVIVGTMVSLAYVKRHGLSVGFDLDLAVLGPFIAFRCLLSPGCLSPKRAGDYSETSGVGFDLH